MKRLICLAMLGLVVACGGGNAAESAPPATPASAPAAEHAEHAEHEHGEKGAGAVKAPGEANVGDTTTCPVSGEEFVVEATSPKVEHEGKTYYMCCPSCLKKFEADPTKYINKS